MFRDPGDDDPGDTHRARVLRVSIGTAVAIAAVTAGLLTSLAGPAAVAVMVGVTAAVGGQAIRGRLEHAADRWVLGSRLAGYANLNRFGRSLIQAPGSSSWCPGCWWKYQAPSLITSPLG